MKGRRRSFRVGWPRVLSGLALSLGLALAAPARAADGACPALRGEAVRWVVPSRPGGGYDAYSRVLEPFLEQALVADVLIVNRPEAGGLVAARQLRDGAPDGRTLGILNATGLLTARAMAEARGSARAAAPHPGRDFTLLGRLASNHVVLFTGAGHGLDDLDALLAAAERRPIVFAVRDLGSTSYFAPPVVAHLLAIEHRVVAGYTGSSTRTLAVLRGEVDAMVANHDSLVAQVRGGDLLPLLQLTPEQGEPLAVPRLDGPQGLAARRASRAGRSSQSAQDEARALAEVIGAGRVIAAPPGLPPDLELCLGRAFLSLASDAGVQQAFERANLGLDWLDGAAARDAVDRAARAATTLAPLAVAALEGVAD